MELGVSHEQNLSSLTPIVVNIFDKYNKKFGTHKISSDHDISIFYSHQFSSSLIRPPIQLVQTIKGKPVPN